MPAKKPKSPSTSDRCEHGLPLLRHEDEKLCALEYLNRFVAPRRVERIQRRGSKLFLVFDSGEKLECFCEHCGESHCDDREFADDIQELSAGRRALRFRMEPNGNLVVWFARGDHLHLHRNALEGFRPRRRGRKLIPSHTPAQKPK